jgi:hypothetical protein
MRKNYAQNWRPFYRIQALDAKLRHESRHHKHRHHFYLLRPRCARQCHARIYPHHCSHAHHHMGGAVLIWLWQVRKHTARHIMDCREYLPRPALRHPVFLLTRSVPILSAIQSLCDFCYKIFIRFSLLSRSIILYFVSQAL